MKRIGTLSSTAASGLVKSGSALAIVVLTRLLIIGDGSEWCATSVPDLVPELVPGRRFLRHCMSSDVAVLATSSEGNWTA